MIPQKDGIEAEHRRVLGEERRETEACNSAQVGTEYGLDDEGVDLSR